MRKSGVIFFCGVLSIAALACGGGDGTRDKAITELSEEEIQSLCEDVNALLLSDEEYAQVVCNISGIMAAEQGGDCQMTIDNCLEDPPTQEPVDCEAAASQPVPDCPEVTAGELFDCQKAQIDQLREGVDLTCSDSADGILDLPPECMALMDVCPELFGDDSAREVFSFAVVERVLGELAGL